MSAKTMSSVTFNNLGEVQAVTGTIASIADGDTLDVAAQCGFNIITNVIATPTTAVVVTPTFSGTTVTFKVATGTPTAAVTVIGK